jgi:hypothetical protein
MPDPVRSSELSLLISGVSFFLSNYAYKTDSYLSIAFKGKPEAFKSDFHGYFRGEAKRGKNPLTAFYSTIKGW